MPDVSSTAPTPCRSSPPVVRVGGISELTSEALRQLRKHPAVIVEFPQASFYVTWCVGIGTISPRRGDEPRLRDALAALCRPVESGESALQGKAHPYRNPARPHNINLNDSIYMAGYDATTFKCGELCLQWIRTFLANTERKPDYAVFDSAKRMLAHMPFHSKIQFGALDQFCSAYAIRHCDWGAFFADRFTDMQAKGTTVSAVELRTVNHSMAVGLKCKEKNGSRHYVILFYDPNRTLTHVRCRLDDLDKVRRIAASSFLLEHRLEEYYPSGDLTLAHPMDEQVLANLSLLAEVPAPVPATLTGPLPPVTPAAMRLLAGNNHSQALRALAPAIKAMPPDARFALFDAELDDPDDIPPLHRIAFWGHRSTFDAVSALIENLPSEWCAKLFSATYKRVPLVYAAITAPSRELAPALFQLIRRTAPRHADEILRKGIIANAYHGPQSGDHALTQALKMGHVAVVEAYLAAIRHVAPETRARLLTTVLGFYQRPCLAQAVVLGHSGIVRTFFEAVRAVPLPQRLELMHDVASLDCDFSKAAAAAGHQATLAVFCQLMDQHLPPAERDEPTRELYARIKAAMGFAPPSPPSLADSLLGTIRKLFGPRSASGTRTSQAAAS